jgi:hypothetical protein
MSKGFFFLVVAPVKFSVNTGYWAMCSTTGFSGSYFPSCHLMLYKPDIESVITSHNRDSSSVTQAAS